MSGYGPFASVVAIASALVATFSVLLIKTLGRMNRWTWLAGDASPPFLVTAGARVLCIALMAAAYVTIDDSNYKWFLLPALIGGAGAFVLIASFDRLRKVHVLTIPLVSRDGNQLRDRRGRPTYEAIVIGSEAEMQPTAKAALDTARTTYGGVSLAEFMSGYGANQVNDPEAIWDRALLAKISNRLTIRLMLIVLFVVTTLFLAALAINASR